MKKIIAAVCAACLCACAFTACSENQVKIDVSEPCSISTGDGVSSRAEGYYYVSNREKAVEDSRNVNGKRFTATLYDFTSRYNALKRMRGEKDTINMGKWQKNGQVNKDENGIKVQYYYYDDEGVDITVTVEEDCGKIMNVGCGTTTKYFTSKTDKENNSDKVLRKAAEAAQAACGYESSLINTLQEIFYHTTTEDSKTLWYDGFVFALSTKGDTMNSKDTLMLFRVFPVTEQLKEEWNLKEYEG